MQEHVDPAEVVSRDIDLLAEESITDLIAAKDLFRFQKERARTASRIVDLVDLCLADGSESGQQFGNIRRREEFASGLAGIGSIHGHQIFIGITESIDIMMPDVAKIHIRNAIQKLDQLLISLCYGSAELVAVDIEVIKQTSELAFRGSAFCRFLDMTENPFQSLVQIFVRNSS